MTTLDWDYSALAAHYNRRAPYADAALDALMAALRLPPGAAVADIGAGTGRLSLPLRARGLRVTAVEPNAALRAGGVDPRASTPRSCSFCFTSGAATTALISRLRRSITAGGVAAGAEMPFHEVTS